MSSHYPRVQTKAWFLPGVWGPGEEGWGQEPGG